MMTGYTVFSPSKYLERCGVSLGLGVGNVTIEMFLQLSDADSVYTGRLPLFSYFVADPAGTDFWLNIILDFGILQLRVQSKSPVDSGPCDLTDGAWHLVAVTIEVSGGSCTYSFYKDGAIIGSPETRQHSCPTIPDGGCVLLGQHRYSECGGVGGSGYFESWVEFQGYLTELRLWNTVRTEAEILEGLSRRINASEAASEPGLVALWPLDCTYKLDDIKGAQNLGSCASVWGQNAPYSLAHIVEMECPCPDERYHRCDEHATYRYTDAGVECTCDAPQWVGDGVSCILAPNFETSSSTNPLRTLSPTTPLQTASTTAQDSNVTTTTQLPVRVRAPSLQLHCQPDHFTYFNCPSSQSVKSNACSGSRSI